MFSVRVSLLLAVSIFLWSQQPSFETESTRLIQLKDWAGLRTLASERLKTKPKDSTALVLLGMSNGNLGRQDDARLCFQKAVEIDSKNASAWFNLGLTQLNQQDIAGLTNSLSKLSNLNDYLRIKLLDHPGVEELLFKDYPPSKSIKSMIKVSYQPKLPPYPFDLRLKKIQGDMLIDVYVGTDGVPMKAERLWGPRDFENYVIQYALAWRFEPCVQNGKAVPFRMRLEMPLRVEGGRPYQALPKEFHLNKTPIP